MKRESLVLHMFSGREIQRWWAELQNALDPVVVQRAGRTLRWREKEDLKGERWSMSHINAVFDWEPVDMLENRSDIIN